MFSFILWICLLMTIESTDVTEEAPTNAPAKTTAMPTTTTMTTTTNLEQAASRECLEGNQGRADAIDVCFNMDNYYNCTLKLDEVDCYINERIRLCETNLTEYTQRIMWKFVVNWINEIHSGNCTEYLKDELGSRLEPKMNWRAQEQLISRQEGSKSVEMEKWSHRGNIVISKDSVGWLDRREK
ncbi:unnamed protein product, partial [Mesorhabditis belari]|uniref:Uncharacterized protein n=1 Tax=Mesorhabditis belari TaxID=2138241 RepID=A0AAF3J450_9BILA